MSGDGKYFHRGFQSSPYTLADLHFSTRVDHALGFDPTVRGQSAAPSVSRGVCDVPLANFVNGKWNNLGLPR